MTGPDDNTTHSLTARRPCLVDGCTCKDARIVSTRRAAFYAALARFNGETADRIIRANPDWQLPTYTFSQSTADRSSLDRASHGRLR